MMRPSLLTLSLIAGMSLQAQQTQGSLTNQRVGSLVQAGVSETEIIRIIATARKFSFDLRPVSTDALIQAGVSEEIIKAMAARESGSPVPATSAAEQIVTPRSMAAHAPSPLSVDRPNSVVQVSPRRVNKSSYVLYQGTPVRMRIMRTVSSADAQAGNNVDFQTLDDIRQNGVVVIPKGSIAIATITVAEPKKRMARGGKLGMNIDYVRMPNGDELPLRGVQNMKGGGHTGAMTGAIVATAIVFWPAAPFFLFMHGKDIVIPEGHEVTVFTNTDYQFSVSDPSSLSSIQ